MKIKELKNILNSKFTIMIIVLSVSIFLLVYLSIKNEYFYNLANYVTTYLDYYIFKYLLGNANSLIVDNAPLIYVEGDLANLYSSLYIYVVTFGSILFKVFSYILPILIFYKISTRLYDEIYKKFSISKIVRIGTKKYIRNTIFVNGVYAGLILTIPRILYFILLSIFFPVGFSGTHFINSASFITQPYLYIGYSYNPYIMILVDLLITFIYGFVISLISIIVVSLIRKKTLSYLIFIFSLAFFSIIPIFLKQAPLISYSSIYNYFEQAMYFTKNINIYNPIIIISSLCIALLIATRFIFSHKLKDSL